MKRILCASMMCAALTGTMLTSCLETPDMYNPNATKERYAAQWEQTFGAIDPNQNWNTATQATANISVSYAGNYTAKIFTSDPRDTEKQSYLLGQIDVKGGQSASLQFDVPVAQQTVYVGLVDKADGIALQAAQIVDGQVNVQFGNAQSRSFEVKDTYTNLDKDAWTFLTNNLKEEVDASDKLCNYEFISNGVFTIAPVYGWTGGNDIIGYYYYDPQTQTYANRTEVTIINDVQDTNKGWSQIKWNGQDWNTVDYQASNYAYAYTWSAEGIRGRNIEISVTAGYRVGFWIKQIKSDGSGYYQFYSNQKLNDDGEYYSAVVNKSGYFFFGLEDWPKAFSVNDCNDIVFAVSAAADDYLPEPVDPDTPAPTPTPEAGPQSWIIACEDLGNTGDFDFNDIVFKISHVSGQTIATFTPLAAGGTLPAYIYYNGQYIKNNNKEQSESHALLGSSSLDILNTYGSRGTPGASVTFNVSSNYSVSNNDMGGFSIHIDNNGKQVAINGPQNGTAPQMICIDGSTDWAWPTEFTNIQEAYPGFGTWGANYYNNTDWYKYPVEGNVVK